MAPERILSSGLPYTVQSDIYSLGLSLCEMALGSYPYPHGQYESLFATLDAIVHGPSPTLPSHFSIECQSLILHW